MRAGAQSEHPANVNLDDHYAPFDKDGNVTASDPVPRGRDEELLSDALGNEHTRSQSDDESDPVGTYTMQDAAADAAPYWNLKMEEGSERLPSVILTLFSDPELKRKAQVRVKNEKPPVLKGDSEKVHREKKFSKNKLNLSVAKAKDEMRQMEGIMALDPKDKKLIKYLQSAISDHLAAKSKVLISIEFRSKGGSVKNPSFNYEVNVSIKSLRDKLFKMKQFLYYAVTVAEELQDLEKGIKLMLYDNLYWKYKDGTNWSHGLTREQYVHNLMRQGLEPTLNLNT